MVYKEKIKVLHIMGCGDVGGISSVVLNYYKRIDRNRIQFDIALNGVSAGRNAKELQQLGAEIFVLPLKKTNRQKYINTLKDILRNGRYDAIHVHENQTSYVALRVAKQEGISCRIAHSHTMSPDLSVREYFRRMSGIILNPIYATKLIACGTLAGDRVFGKRNMKSNKAMILPNAVDCEKFRFDESARKRVRKEICADNDFIQLMVGRLESEKNVFFAIRATLEFHKTRPESLLLIAGEGTEKEEIRRFIKTNDASDYIKLLGNRSDVNELMSAADVLMLPSVYEGFPVVAVEGITNGLPVLLSDRVTDEFKEYAGTRYLSINDTREWVEALNEIAHNKSINRLSGYETIKKGRLNIDNSVAMLQRIYESNAK